MTTLIGPAPAPRPARRSEQDRSRVEHAVFMAVLEAAWASIAAYRAGLPAPLSPLIGALEELGQLPPEQASPQRLLAMAHEADQAIDDLVAELLGGEAR
jgi:hypothetical protein